MRFKWTLQVEVDKCWIQDGFDFTDDYCRELEMALIPDAYEGEVFITVTKAPDPEAIKREQKGN